MSLNITEIKKIKVNRKTLAALLGYKNENSINNLVSVHAAPRSDHNEYPLFDFIIWHREYVEKNHQAEIDRVKSEKPQDLLARRNAELKEIELQQKRKELIPFTQVQLAWLNEFQMLKMSFQGLGIKASPSLINKQTQKEVVDIIDLEVNTIFDRIAKRGLDISSSDTTNNS